MTALAIWRRRGRRSASRFDECLILTLPGSNELTPILRAATTAAPIFGALAEFERNVIRERTCAALAAARARGRKGGRRKKLGEKQLAVAVDLYRQKSRTIDEICKAVNISRPTLYKYVAAAGDT
jgi:DNA invertase Pin-like site-specific DNA recombinase